MQTWLADPCQITAPTRVTIQVCQNLTYQIAPLTSTQPLAISISADDANESENEQVAERLYVGQMASSGLLTDRNSQGSRYNTSLKCTWPGCTYEGTFRRKYERDRHIAQNGRNCFKCPGLGCNSQNKKPFRRADKLTLHLRSSHDLTTVYDCVESGCTTRLQGNFMFVHLQRHLLTSPSEVSMTTKAVINGLSPAFPRCPVPLCATNVPLDQLPAHLLRHHSTQITSMHQELLQTNYLCIHQPICEYENPHYGKELCPVTLIYVTCPVCAWLCQNYKCFYVHLVVSHVLKDDEHFQTWSSGVNEVLVHNGYEWIGSPPDLHAAWKPWQLALLSAANINLNIYCPACNVVEAVESGGPIMHHLTMLAEYEHLLAYRYKILGLYPAFASHPVFEDTYNCQFDIIQVFRLKRTAPKMISDIAYNPILSNCINTNTPFPPDVLHPDDLFLNIYDTAWFDNQLFNDFEPLPEFDSSTISHLGNQFHPNPTIAWPCEGSEPYRRRENLSHDNSALTSGVQASLSWDGWSYPA